MVTPLVALMLMASNQPADLHIVNANVWTGDRSRPRAEALAIAAGRIAAVGNRPEIGALRGPKTRVIDAKGRLVLPGFNDAHVHFMQGGYQLDGVDLKDAASPQEFASRIAARAKSRPGQWIVGGDWDEQRWPGAPLPTRDLIDRSAPDTPVFVSRYDGHMAVANSAALRIARVDEKTKAPPGGEILRDSSGRPTGLLKDAAMDFVFRAIPPPTREQRLAAIRRAMAHAASLGVTSVQDMGTEAADYALYEELARSGELTLRISAVRPISGASELALKGVRRAHGTEWLRLGAVKAFTDGSLGSTTAYFIEPYADAPGSRGLLMQPMEQLRAWIAECDRAGLQLSIHAIGDRAISELLDAYESVAKQNGSADRRFRIEHAQHMAPGDIDRMAKLEVIASVQPYHAIDDGRWAERRIGPKRAETTYAFRTFLDRGVRLALGTDWTVAPLDPMQTLYAAVTRATLDGAHPEGWVPAQKITLEEAVRAYTEGSAYAEFQPEKGALAPGKLADIVVLSRDIFRIPAAEIRNVRADLTIAGGKVVFER